MLLVIDNTKDLENAIMTPNLLRILDELGVQYSIASTRTELISIIDTMHSEITGIILSGGPLCLSGPTQIADMSKNLLVLLSFNVPILGICFGFQVIAAAFGADLVQMSEPITGEQQVAFFDHQLFRDLPRPMVHPMFQHHCDALIEPPHGFKVIACSEKKIEGIAHNTRPVYGVQFHPERSGAVGKQIIQNFIHGSIHQYPVGSK
jgi:GMP synthase-like glutamine amidotransferase